MDAQQVEAQQMDAQQMDAQMDAQQVDVQQVDAQQVDAQQMDALQVDAQQADAQQADVQQVDAQQVDAQQVDAQQVDAQQATAHHSGDGQLLDIKFIIIPEGFSHIRKFPIELSLQEAKEIVEQDLRIPVANMKMIFDGQGMAVAFACPTLFNTPFACPSHRDEPGLPARFQFRYRADESGA